MALPLNNQNDPDALIKKLLSQHPEARQKAVSSGLITQTSLSNQTQLDKALEAFKSINKTCLKVRDYALKLSGLNDNVLITGESGTGKELIAKILHGRRSGEFVGLNINAISNTLFESELFGHIKGSFTGAITERIGLVEQADRGTLFIDEIGDLSLEQQVKLLRLIQEGTYRRVGESSISKAGCRFVFATHRDLKNYIRLNLFRRDLFERISSFKIHIPPLRERLEDLSLFELPEGLLNRLSSQQLQEQRNLLSGNVRQLLNLKRQIETLGEDSISTEDLL